MMMTNTEYRIPCTWTLGCKNHGGMDTSPHVSSIRSISYDDDDDDEEDGGLNIWSYIVSTDTFHRK